MFEILDGPKVISRTIRPPRLAYIVSEITHCDAVIRACSLTWGGKYSCLIPYTPGREISEEWWRVLRNYDPDDIVTCIQVDNRTEDELLDLVAHKIPKNKSDNKHTLPVWNLILDNQAIHGLSLLTALYGIGGIESKDKFKPVFIPKIPEKHPLEIFIKARYGSLDNDLLRWIITNEFQKWDMGLDDFIPVNEIDLADNYFDFLQNRGTAIKPEFLPIIEYTLLGVSQQQIGIGFPETEKQPIMFNKQYLLIVSDGTSVEDCCWFWNLRSQRYLPDTLLPLWLPKDVVYKNIASITGMIPNNQRGYILSKSVSLAELQEIAQKFGDKTSAVSHDFDRFYTPDFFLGIKDQVEVNFDQNRVRIPKPKADVVRYCYHPHCYYIDIELPDRVLPRINTSVWGDWFFGNYRVSRTGISFIEQGVGINDYIELTVPNPWQMLETFAGLANYDIQLSDKGILGEKVVQLIGGYQNMWMLSGATLYNLFDHMSELNQAREFKHRLRELKETLKSDFDGEQTIAEIMRMISTDYHERIQVQYGELKQNLGYSSNLTKKLINWLLKRKLIFRGVVISCPSCKTKQWVLLDDLSSQIVCAGCQLTVDTPLDADTTQWMYRINTLYAKAQDQGVIPHILTTQYFLDRGNAISRKHKRTIGAFFGIKLKAANGFELPNPEAEIDVAWIENGELSIGECKTNSLELKETEILKYLQIAKALQCKRVVFSFMDEISQELEHQIQMHFSKTSIAVEIANREDLYNQYYLRSLLEEKQEEKKRERKESFEQNISAFLDREEERSS